MSEYRSQVFPILCKGRDTEGNECLEKAVQVELKVSQSPGTNSISSQVTCPYNTGGHGQRCTAFDLGTVEKTGQGILCPYAFDIPYALERRK